MRGVTDWNLIINKQEDQNYYTAIKKINKINQPFIIGKKTLIDNDYYIIEFTPLDYFYNVRVFLDKTKEVICYYFDISKGNGVEDNIPYYDDLYLDIIYSPSESNVIRVEDEDELIDALKNGSISSEEYNLARNTCETLIKEIKEGQNVFININKYKFINAFFK